MVKLKVKIKSSPSTGVEGFKVTVLVDVVEVITLLDVTGVVVVEVLGMVVIVVEVEVVVDDNDE